MNSNFTIRKASVKDASVILKLINQYANESLMLPKTPYKIYTTIQNFFVAETNDKNIVGCVALNVLWEDMGEICSLAIDKDHQRQGIATKLVKEAIEVAKSIELPKVIALTYQKAFFEYLGFTLVDKDKFPRKLWRECLECPKLEVCDELAYVLEF